jgi:hypothetical protein
MPTYGRHFEPGQLQFIPLAPTAACPSFPSLASLTFCGGFARGSFQIQLPPRGWGPHARTFPPALAALAAGSDPGNDEGTETVQRPRRPESAEGAAGGSRLSCCFAGVSLASHGPRPRALPRLAAPICAFQRLHGKKTAGKAQLHAQQSRKTPSGSFARRLALVKLEVLLLGRSPDAGDGLGRVNCGPSLAQGRKPRFPKLGFAENNGVSASTENGPSRVGFHELSRAVGLGLTDLKRKVCAQHDMSAGFFRGLLS